MKVKSEKTMATQISRIGSSVTVEIPEDLLRRANLAVGDPVEWVLTTNGALALHGPSFTQGEEDGYEDWKFAEIRTGLAGIDAGKTVPGDKVIEWLESWGTDHELAPPR